MDIVDFGTVGATEETAHGLRVAIGDGLMQVINAMPIPIEMARKRMCCGANGNPWNHSTSKAICQVDIV